ncbi:hypothetical protein GCM10010300_49350 [Streptomyces olivaceoviridis]|nr:hypothetical protein GCM10010300_49350 [Streptomyces olivaceoviridis]
MELSGQPLISVAPYPPTRREIGAPLAEAGATPAPLVPAVSAGCPAPSHRSAPGAPLAPSEPI